MPTSPNGSAPLSITVARALAVIDGYRRVAIAEASAVAAVTAARLDSLSDVTRTAMDDIASLSRWERDLVGWAPTATDRLGLLLDVATVGYSTVIDAAT